MKTFIKTTVVILLLNLTFAIHNSTFSQNVGISATGTTPNASAGLDIDFNNKGLLLPRMSTIERNAIPSPAHSLLIYNTTTDCFEAYNATTLTWVAFGCIGGCSVPTAVTASATPSLVCAGSTLNLTGGATGATTWSWTGPNGFTSTSQNPAIASITTAGAGVYTLMASNTCGSATAVNTASVIVNSPIVSATGGTITYTDASGLNPRSSPAYSGGYAVHTFTGSGIFTVTSGCGNVNYLVVAGGGGGGSNGAGGGGGAGGVLSGTLSSVSIGSYTVTVGGGGATATSGSNSVFSTITANGGGYGTMADGGNGGSGGGSGRGASSTSYKGLGTSGQGNDGGTAGYYSGQYPASGGGGAGAVGGSVISANPGTSGAGGIGVSNAISGTATYYGGGGGGGGDLEFSRNLAPGAGGNGGGGAGGASGNGISGTANTGGGGGGGGCASNNTCGLGGAGGSGIVIIRYVTP